MLGKHQVILAALLVSACGVSNLQSDTAKQKAFDCPAANEKVKNLRQEIALLKEEENRQKDEAEIAAGAGAAIGTAIGWVLAGGDSTTFIASELGRSENASTLKYELIALLKERREKCSS